MELCNLVTLFTFIVSTCSAFELVRISRVSPTVPLDSKLRLTCEGDGHYRYCKLIPNKNWVLVINSLALLCGTNTSVWNVRGMVCGTELDNVKPQGRKYVLSI